MRMNDDAADRPGGSGLTTESLAHPGKARDPAVYPGEATAGWDEGGRSSQDRDAPAGTQEPEAEAQGREPGAQEPEPDVRTVDDQPLLGQSEAQRFRSEWSGIQGRFVDEPKEAVRAADALVAEVMQTLAQTFNAHKQELEGQWTRGEEVATEELRLALQRYRSFFTRLLRT